jgi:hypothetical protein
LIYGHLGYSLVVVQKELLGFAPLIWEMSESSKSVIDYAHYINETVLCSGSMMSTLSVKKSLNSLESQNKYRQNFV